MWKMLREGWRSAVRQPFVFLTLFVYRLVWGLVLYSLVQSVVLPLLQRYPGRDISVAQLQLFMAEGQFQLLKTDISHPYLWLLLGLLLARMIITPILNAAVFFSLRHTRLNPGYRFFKGIGELTWPFLGCYVLQMLLTALPLAFLVPGLLRKVNWHGSYSAIASALLPYAAGALIYGYLLYLLFLHIQFGIVWDKSALHSLRVVLRRLLPTVGMAAVLLLLAFLFTSAVLTAGMVWAGFWALIVFQIYRLVDTFIGFWNISAQHELYARHIL